MHDGVPKFCMGRCVRVYVLIPVYPTQSQLGSPEGPFGPMSPTILPLYVRGVEHCTRCSGTFDAVVCRLEASDGSQAENRSNEHFHAGWSVCEYLSDSQR